MATYTAATFIPQLQPYQPDLNLYSNLIQNSQSQYDSNWKSLNKIYGQYFYADLTREDNAKKKDYLLNQINFNVGRLAGLDLSLQQNVAQATQVFKPFYEDKALMKDMAWTKNYNSQVGKAEALQGSADEKRRAEFWDTGLKELQYKREEFKEATADKAMGMGNVLYTPYVNVQDKALNLAKEYGDIQTVTRSEDGRWLIKKTNGEALEEPLSKLFEANMGSDPQIQAIYQTQSYVNRKDYAQSNAAQFNGDKNAAEMKYLENNFTILKDQSKKRYESLQKNSTVYDSKIKDLQAQIKNGTASPDAQNLLDNYMEGKQINDSVLERAKKDYDTMSSGESNTATTSTGFKNPYGDIESLRFKVDNGVASSLMQKDLDEAAHVFAYRHYKEDPEADPYAILAEKHQNTMAEISARTQGQMQVAEYKAKLKDKQDSDQSKVDAGTHYKDKDGNLVEFEDQNFVTTVPNDKGNTTDKINLKSKSREISNMTKQEYLDPFFKSTFKVIDKAIVTNKMSDKTAAYILGYSKDKKVSAKEFIDKYNKYGDSWLRKYVGQDGMNSIKNRMNTWVGKNRQLDIFTENGQRTQLYKDYQNGNAKMDDYMLYLKSDQKWRKDSAKSVEKAMMRDGYQYAYLLYDDKGNLRSEKEFLNQLKSKNIVSSNTLNMYKQKILTDTKYRKELEKLAKEKGDKGFLSFLAQSNPITGTASALVNWATGSKGSSSAMNKYYGKKIGNFIENVGPGNWLDNFVEGKILEDIDYKTLVNKAGQLYSNSKVVKGNPARLGSGPIDPGTGLSTIGSSSIVVNPKGMSAGKAHFGEIAQALNGFDWGGNTDRFTLGGLSKSAYDNSPKARRDAQGQALAKAIMMDFNKAQMKGSKSKLSQFELRVSPIAAGNSKLAAVTIIPNKEWLAEYKSTNDETPNNLLTSEEYTKALTHGLTYVMDNSKLNNVTMYKQSYSSPIASYVESFKKYELKNIGGDSNKSYTIEKNELGTGDYITTVTFPEFDPVKGTIVKKTYRSNDVMQGGYLETNRDQILNWFNEVDDNNNYLFNNYTRVE
jgi:hypothetical protein